PAMTIVTAGQTRSAETGFHSMQSAVPALIVDSRRPLTAMLTASIAAEAVLFPIGATLFSRVTFAGLGLNFLAIPLMAVAQVAGMLLVPVSVISDRLAAAAGLIAHAGAEGLVVSAQLVDFLPFSTWRVSP